MHSFVRSLIEKKKIHEAETGNLPGARTHILNKDVRDPDHGIIPNGIVLRHTGDDKYEVRAGRAKGKIISIDKQYVNKLDESAPPEAPVGGEVNTSWMNAKHQEFYKKNPHFKRNNRARVGVGTGTQLATRVDPGSKPAQVKRKPLTSFSVKEEAPPKDSTAPKMVQDRKTGKMYDPQKKFRELMGKPETKAIMKRLAKEEAEQVDEKSKGLWANIHAKRKRGERPAKPGEEGYPKTLNIESVESIDEISADTARSYLDKSKTAKPDLAKAAKRFGGSMRAQGVIHRDELKKMSTRLAQQRKDLGLTKESSGDCAVCGRKPCNCTSPIIGEADNHRASIAKGTARIEQDHREQRMAAPKKAINKLQENSMKSLKQIIAEAEQKSVHPDGIHVKPVKVNGQQKYHVHAVGKNFQSGIKVGEHLSDSELDDFSEMGGRVKHVK